MNAEQQKSLLTIALLAAFADGGNSEAERAEFRRIADSLTSDGLNLAALYQDVLLKRVSLDDALRGLDTVETRNLAYELAVCVANADGTQNEAEQAFLARLHGKLGLDPAATAGFSARVEALAAAPLAGATEVEPPHASTMASGELNAMILNYATLNGALELLPDTLASMAIIPLQMKMVYRIGKAHGFDLDRDHVKDFLATLGVGLASQYLERVGVRLVGKLLGSVGGRLLGSLAGQAVSTGFSFATTYALGHVAIRYYAGGRTLSADGLRQAYADAVAQAKDLQARYLPEMRERARTLDVGKVLAEVGK